jgi:hypothetical protein
MIIEKDLAKLLQQLLSGQSAQINLGGSITNLQFFESKLSLSTSVYFGGNFIPQSVRKCVLQKSPFNTNSIKGYLSIDENDFRIDLNYEEIVNPISYGRLVDLLEEFSWQAEEWRLFLDEHDKNDLVYIRAK